MKAAIYCRVSTQDQTTANQELALRDYCQRNNIEVHQVYTDQGISGAKTTRPALDRMLQDMRAGYFQAIVIWKLDRLGRSTQHLLQLMEEFNNKSIRLIVTTMNLDTNTAQGRFFFTIIGAVAELERELIRERIAAGLVRARKEGKRCGRPSGSRDKNPRRRSGYWARWADKKPSPHKMAPFSSTEKTKETMT